jgi:hypothetical protein
MDVRILDLDGSLPQQRRVLRHQPALLDARGWGPRIRLACSLSRFRDFQSFLSQALGSVIDARPQLTLYGSGDFHHVSLALLQRVPGPCNVLILDKHPDWMVGLPFLHCGTWVAHALRMNTVRRIFHLGGDLDFDNRYRWLAPWEHLRSGRIVVFPAQRRFTRGRWAGIRHEPLRDRANHGFRLDRLEALLEPYRAELERLPLYISVDKDVLTRADAIVSWDSGHLHLAEVETILEVFSQAARGRIAGMDLVGDWSPVKVQGWFRRLLHLVEHESLAVDPAESTRRNEATNLTLIAGCVQEERLGAGAEQPHHVRYRELLHT